MRGRRYGRVLLVLVMLATASGSAWAEGNPPVTDLGNNIYLVDGNKGAIPNLLPAEEVQKIATLQSAPIGIIYSHASPIKTPLLAFHGTNGFLPITVMQNFMLQVIDNKVPAKLLKFQDADHGFLRYTPPALSNAYDLYGAQEQLIWFRTYLMQAQ